MKNYILILFTFLVCTLQGDLYSQQSKNSVKAKYYGERLFWKGPKKIFSESHFNDGKIINADFFDIYGKKVGSCTYIDDYPYSGTILDHDLIWTVITKKTYEKGFVVGTIIDYDIKFKELNKYSADNSPTINAENYQYASTKDGNPYNGKFVIEYSQIEYKNGLMHGFKKNFNFLTRDTFEIISYKKGQKDGLYQYLAIKDSILAQGIYKKDLPYSGSFIDLNNFIFKTFNSYKKGVQIGIDTYYFEYDSSKTNTISSYKLINTCRFKNGKPFNGTFYDKTKHKFVSYLNGSLAKVYKIDDRKMDTIEIQSFENDKLHGYCKSKVTFWIEDYIVGYYKNGQPFDGEFLDEKKRQIINEYANGQQIASKDYNIGFVPNFYSLKDGKKNGVSKQHIEHSNDTTTYISIYKDDLPYEGQICVKDELLTYKNGKLDGQCILLDGSRKKARKIAQYKDGVIITVTHYNVLNSTDSITTNYVGGVILDGVDIQYYEYETKLYNYKNGKITSDSTIFQNRDNYMVFKEGRKFEGIEYTRYDQYTAENKVDLITKYKDFKVVNMKGGAHKEWAFFEMNCDDSKCTLIDYSPKKFKTIIDFNKNNSLKNVTTYKENVVVSQGLVQNDTIEQGKFTFVNYASRFDKMLSRWIYLELEMSQTQSKINVIMENQKYSKKYIFNRKLTVDYPVYELHKVFNQIGEYKIEYLSINTQSVIASCDFLNGTPISGITLEQYESKVTIEKYDLGQLIKSLEVHSTDLEETLSKL